MDIDCQAKAVSTHSWSAILTTENFDSLQRFAQDWCRMSDGNSPEHLQTCVRNNVLS